MFKPCPSLTMFQGLGLPHAFATDISMRSSSTPRLLQISAAMNFRLFYRLFAALGKKGSECVSYCLFCGRYLRAMPRECPVSCMAAAAKDESRAPTAATGWSEHSGAPHSNPSNPTNKALQTHTTGRSS
ncbi:hypothetical protein ElyMa_002524500 [Elysia marginata]|uniref:Uncharacterized protein n=1 Tax=Elysia marginata TaxID=1093978 RepID=A0AAV4GVH6_9GAST|nr:hypothetical protein ElyMa_002524500 [Elysia marginata]